MRNLFLLILLPFISCHNMEKEKDSNKINLRNRTFVLIPENNKGTLTVQFMDSTCNLLELDQYDRHWRLVNFEGSNTLVLNHMIISLHRETDSTLIGFNIGEKDIKLKLKEKKPKWKLDEILGKWTEERWVGIEKLNIPTPAARIEEHDSIWPPYYEISKKIIISYCLGIDSTQIQIDNSLSFIKMKNNLHTDFVGYQKDWKLLKVTDSALTIERRFTKNFSSSNSFSYSDSTETLRLIKKR